MNILINKISPDPSLLKRGEKKINNFKALFFILSAMLLALSACENTTGEPWVFGRDAGRNVIRVEDHSDQFIHFLKAGYRDRILIHVDGHDDSRFIEDAKMSEIKRLADLKDYAALKENSGISYSSSSKLFNIGNWIYAAYKMGNIKEVYWVVPADRLSTDNLDYIKKYLRRVGFNEESVDSFRTVDGYIRGNRNGLPVILCTSSDIPKMTEPVLISLDIDYLPAFYKNPVETPMLDLFLDLYNNFKRQNISTDSVIISYSVNGGTTPLMHKYTGDYLYEAIKDPGVINNIPPSWKHRAGALQKRHKKIHSESIEDLNRAIKLEPGNAGLYFDLAVGHIYFNDLDSAFSALQKSVSRDPAYFLGFVEIGEMIRRSGTYDNSAAVNFVASAQKLVPENSKSRLFMSLGLAYFQNGAFRKAQLEYNKALKAMTKEES